MSLRKMMNAHKSAIQISHPFARYSTKGLSCSLCNLPVKHENLWASHLNSKQHRANAQRYQQEESRKRALATEAEVTEARQAKRQRTQDQDEDNSSNAKSNLPADFFDKPPDAPVPSTSKLEPSSSGPSSTANVPEEEDDEEWLEFERAILSGPAPTSDVQAAATISAPARLLDEDGNIITEDGQPAEPEVEETLLEVSKESVEEKREREEKEELMARIDEEEREQQEADSRVVALKARLDLIRQQKLKKK